MRLKNYNSFSLIRRFKRKQIAIRVVLCLLCLLLLNLCCGKSVSKYIGDSFVELKVKSDNYFSKIANVINLCIEQFTDDIDTEIIALKKENAELKYRVEELENLRTKNEQLSILLDLKEKYKTDIVIARVSTIFLNDFARAGIINIGRDKGVEKDSIVINDKGLVGRVIEVHDNWSKLFLIIDENFNTPSKIGDSANAIITGVNSQELKISLVHEDINIKEGDTVTTSEYGSLFNSKIPIGKIAIKDGEFYVKPFVDFHSLNYVGVIIKHDK